MLSDTRNLLYYFRLSPDRRLVFGGRAAFVPTALERSAALLVEGIGQVFPELRGVRIEYAWGGTLGFTLDHCRTSAGTRGSATRVGYGGHGVAHGQLAGGPGRSGAGRAAPWPDWLRSRFLRSRSTAAGRGFCRSPAHITGSKIGCGRTPLEPMPRRRFTERSAD